MNRGACALGTRMLRSALNLVAGERSPIHDKEDGEKKKNSDHPQPTRPNCDVAMVYGLKHGFVQSLPD